MFHRSTKETISGEPIGVAGKKKLRAADAPTRVLMIAPSLDILGGQAVQAGRLLSHLREEPSLEIDLLPINPRLPGALRKLQSIKYVRTLVTSVLYLGMLLARMWKYDVVHVFSASYFSFVLAPTPAILIAKLYGKKIVLNYRSGEAKDHLERWRQTAIPTLHLVDVIATPSGYLVDVFARFGLHALSIFNIVETDKFRFRARAPLQPSFLSNRNFEPLYNVHCVLRAFALIQQRFPAANLIIAGDGSQRAELEALARELGLRDTQFIGRVAPEKMPELYNAADIYLNAPDIDNMPGSIIESFAAGLPVVTTNAGGIPYIVTNEETGLMVPCGDYQAMAACAIRLLENQELALRIAHAAYGECLKYSWKAVRDEWLKLYQTLTHEKHKPQSEKVLGKAPVRER